MNRAPRNEREAHAALVCFAQRAPPRTRPVQHSSLYLFIQRLINCL